MFLSVILWVLRRTEDATRCLPGLSYQSIKQKHTMNTKRIIFISLLCILVNACNKETVDPADPKPVTPVIPFEKTKKGMLCNEWTLKETFVDGVQKTTNGTGKYKFQTDGGFYYFEKGDWQNIGSYNFTTKDSNTIAMTFTYGGTSYLYWWNIKKLDQKNYNIEFDANGQKLNYNYVR